MNDLLKKMTLEEKASMMSGKDFWQSQDVPRLGIKSMFLADGPHGIRKQAEAADHLGLNASIPATCFPTAATVANSWDVELGEKIGESLGQEALVQNVNVLLGPGINIKRNPLCGRNFEYFSEDPHLAGKLAASYVRGIQSKGISACVKHFAVNNQEERRMSIDTIVDERALREIYLTAFEIVVKEGKVRSLMSSYNRLNGEYANENSQLLLEILRHEWGYDGIIVSDWGGNNDRVAALIAGSDLEMPTNAGETDQDILRAIRKGDISESLLDVSVERLLSLGRETSEAIEDGPDHFNLEEHHKMAQHAAEESIVLLKNKDSILPLDKGLQLAVIGDFAEHPRYQGAGSSIVNPTILENTLTCLEEEGIHSIGYEPGFDRYGRKKAGLIKKACSLAEKADAVLLYLGLDEVTEAEGLDRSFMTLPENQIALLDAVAEKNPHIVVILSCGSAIEMPWIGKVKGLLHAYLSGQAGARALLRAVSGRVNPSGKLAETYPLRYEETPSAPYFPGKEESVEYRESLYVGYRYFQTLEKKVLFPFGFGLSYTEFTYSDIRVDSGKVSCVLTNSGHQDGKEVVQLYVARQSADIFRPARELKGFKKIFLRKGESITVEIPFDDRTFRYFNIKTERWEVEAGEYDILLGASSADIRLRTTFFTGGTDAVSPYESISLSSYFSGRIESVQDEEFRTLIGRDLPSPRWDRKKPLGYNDTIAQCRYARGLFARFSYGLLVFAHWFLKKIGKRETANLLIMSVYHMPFRGMARMTGGLITMPMVDGMLEIVNGRFFRGLRNMLRANKNKKKESKKKDK